MLLLLPFSERSAPPLRSSNATFFGLFFLFCIGCGGGEGYLPRLTVYYWIRDRECFTWIPTSFQGLSVVFHWLVARRGLYRSVGSNSSRIWSSSRIPSLLKMVVLWASSIHRMAELGVDGGGECSAMRHLMQASRKKTQAPHTHGNLFARQTLQSPVLAGAGESTL